MICEVLKKDSRKFEDFENFRYIYFADLENRKLGSITCASNPLLSYTLVQWREETGPWGLTAYCWQMLGATKVLLIVVEVDFPCSFLCFWLHFQNITPLLTLP